MKIEVLVASEKHLPYATAINDAIDNAAKARGTGIARRTNEYIADKIRNGKAIIALNRDEFVGFCYIESWGHQKFVANSGLIVVPAYRRLGIAKKIKKAAFDLSRKRFPHAKLFGLTTGEQVMRINTSLGYVPVTFAKLTDDEEFWNGCKSCVNYDILQRTNMTKCLCTGMIYDPEARNRTKDANRFRFMSETITRSPSFNPPTTSTYSKLFSPNTTLRFRTSSPSTTHKSYSPFPA